MEIFIEGDKETVSAAVPVLAKGRLSCPRSCNNHLDSISTG
jgi:hypothetical protein